MEAGVERRKCKIDQYRYVPDGRYVGPHPKMYNGCDGHAVIGDYVADCVRDGAARIRLVCFR